MVALGPFGSFIKKQSQSYESGSGNAKCWIKCAQTDKREAKDSACPLGLPLL